MRVARLNRSGCTDAEQFINEPMSVCDALDLADELNIMYYTNPHHYYAVVDDQYWLKNQPIKEGNLPFITDDELADCLKHIKANP